MGAAIARLEVSLDVLRNNEPIHRAEGQIEQADCDAAAIVDIEQALNILRQC